MAKTLNGEQFVLTTSEADIYTASNNTMTLLVQAVNTTAGAVTCELWMTDGSNNHVACLFPSQSIAAYDGISDSEYDVSDFATADHTHALYVTEDDALAYSIAFGG